MVATWHEFWGDHWLDYLEHRPAVARIARLTESLCAPMADEVVAVSSFTAGRLDARLKGRPCTVIENGIDLRQIERASAADPGVDVLFVGRLIEDKRVDVLLRAVAMLRAERPHISCEIVGDGPERHRLEALAGQLGIADTVRFAGIIDEQSLFGRMKSARVFALPSIREGFGIVVVEAQACGAVPVVARAPHSAASSLVEDGRTGLVCDPDPASFAAALGGLLDDEARRVSIAREARASAARRDWDRIAEQLEAVYRTVVAGRGRRRLAAPPESVAGGPS